MRYTTLIGVAAISLASAALAQTVSPGASPQNGADPAAAGYPAMQSDPNANSASANSSDNAAEPGRKNKRGHQQGEAPGTDDTLSRPGSSAGTAPPPR